MFSQTVITSADILAYWPLLVGIGTLVAMSAVQLYKLRAIEAWVKHHRHHEDGRVYLTAESSP